MFFSGSALPVRMSTLRPGDDRVAHLQADRLEDVALLAVGVGQERDPRRAVRVVLNRRHLRRDVALVTLEVDHAVHPLVTAAAPPRGQLAAIVAAARAMQRLDERLVRLRRGDVVEDLHRLEPLARRRRVVLSNRHRSNLSLRAFEELGDLLAFAQRHVRLLPVAAAAGEPSLPLDLAVRDARPDARHLRAEQLLDRALDLDLVGAPVATSNTIVLPSSRRMDVFSVISGRRMTSVSFMLSGVTIDFRFATPGQLLERLLELLEGALRRDHAIGVRRRRAPSRARSRPA